MIRTIEYTKKFKRDYKREKNGRYASLLDEELLKATALLVADKKLPERYCDHPLKGEWSDHRDCHLKPDLVLIYAKPNKLTLQLVRIGSHSELSL